MEVKEITEKSKWENFIESVKPNTFLHTWAWGEFEKYFNRQVFRFGVYEKNILISVALFSKITARRGTFLLCPHGPIFSPSVKNIQPVIDCILKRVVEVGKSEKCDFIRVSTMVLDTLENRQAFKKAGFRNAPIHTHSELAWILDIAPKEEVLMSGMKKNTRYSIRKAEKDGVTVRESVSMDDFEDFLKIYDATASRQNFTPYSREYLKKEFEIFFKEGKAVLFFAEYQGRKITTAFVVFSNGSGYYHQGASDNVFPGVTASELVQWKAICEAKRRGMSRYNFWGVVPESAVKHPWHGLSKFKRGFGGYEEAYVHSQDFVLTSKYWINFIVETVRKIKRRV